MDYIQEELLRQRAALAGLLLGGGAVRREAAGDAGKRSAGSTRRPERETEETEPASAPEAAGEIAAPGTYFGAAAGEMLTGGRSFRQTAAGPWRIPGASPPGKEAPLAGGGWTAAPGRPETREAADGVRVRGAAYLEAPGGGRSGREAHLEPAGGGRSGGEAYLEPADGGRSGGAYSEAASPAPAGGGWTAEVPGGPDARQAAGGIVRERTVTEVWQAGSGGALEPEALSRAFQRDARRYDGGFTPY